MSGAMQGTFYFSFVIQSILSLQNSVFVFLFYIIGMWNEVNKAMFS
jgi:hypothetical protein